MLLSDRDLIAELKSGQFQLEPFDPALVQPSSVDVRLGGSYRYFAKVGCDVDTRCPPENLTELDQVPDGQPLRLHPGEFLLGSTLEVVTVDPGHAVKLEGRSSLGRLGLEVHRTAGWVDPGFSGHITLELSNVGPNVLLLWPGMAVAQLCVFRLSSPAVRPYSAVGRYQGQHGPTASLGVGR